MAKAATESDAGGRASVGGDPLVGKVLDGRFRIVERLGAGGMGTVYKAVQAPLDRIVALKVLNPNYDSKRDPGFQRRFFLEASVTSKLKHPNTITVIDYGKTDEDIYYLAMEYVEGVTLAQVLVSEGLIPWQRALHITQQICRSLREAHRAGMIHRDLKPANVMVCNEETDSDLVKVLDFGLVKSFMPEALAQEPAELTQAGVFLGSPQYMAPEQARNIADPRSDIYSVGVVLFQMLTGKPPFWAEQSIDVIVKHMKEPPPAMHSVRPDLDLPPEVEALVRRCLEKEPAKRFQTMDEMLESIRMLGNTAGLSGVFGAGSRSLLPNTPGPMRQLTQTGAHRAALMPTPSGMQRIPPSGNHSGPRSAPGTFKQPTAPASVAMEISVETSAVMSAARPVPKGKKVLPLLIFGGSLLVGLAVVFVLLRPGPPPPTPAPTPVVAPVVVAPPPPPVVEAAPSPVTFRIVSDPPGAEVFQGEKSLGLTPLTLPLLPGADGVASASLRLQLEGYEPLEVQASGAGPEVAVNPRLRKLPEAPTPKPKTQKKKVNGYKEDPY